MKSSDLWLQFLAFAGFPCCSAWTWGQSNGFGDQAVLNCSMKNRRVCQSVSKKVTSRCEASWDQFAFALTAKCLMLSLGGSTYNLWWCVWCVNHKLVTQGRIQHRCTSKRRTSLKCRMVGWRIARIQRLYTCLFNEKQQQHQLHCRDLRSLLACYLHDSFSTWWESKALPQTKWFFKL